MPVRDVAILTEYRDTGYHSVVMKRDNKVREHSLQTVTLLRGLYKRIAVRFKVDLSYVSRVARGERKSKVIEAALRKEMERILRTTET